MSDDTFIVMVAMAFWIGATILGFFIFVMHVW